MASWSRPISLAARSITSSGSRCRRCCGANCRAAARLASRKLGFGASRTMRIAQRLYEGIDLDGDTVGLITYMRTDGVAIAGEAIAAARQLTGSEFGPRYVPGEPRVYRSPAKNAQEAHEAIRPTDLARRPDDVTRHLDNDNRRLYELI